MIKSFRTSVILAALAAAALSQAQAVNYIGNGPSTMTNGGFTSTSLGAFDTFNFASSFTNPAATTVTLYLAGAPTTSTSTGSQVGASGLSLLYTAGPSVGFTLNATAVATGFGTLSNLRGTGLTITRNNQFSYALSVQGSVTPVPEPASVAALGIGALGIVARRRRKA